MITTLSGGGAGLGTDVRDGFLLALKQAGDAGAEVTHPALRGPSIVIVLSGRDTLAADGKHLPLSPGLVYFIGAATAATFVGTEALEIGRAFVEPRN